MVAKSFARIFYRNAINIGLPIIVCDGEFRDGDALSVDLTAGTLENRTTGKRYAFPPFPPFLQKIIAAGGLMNAMAEGGYRMSSYHIVLVPGDGIGPEIVGGAVRGAESRGGEVRARVPL